MRLNEEPIGLTLARWVVERGGHVLPCYINKELEKFPLVKGGVNAATRDIEKIEGWWDRYAYAHVGVSSRPRGWICFDADGPAARDWILKLASDKGGTGQGLLYETPGRSGGCHLWYSWPSWLAPFHSSEVRGSVGEVELRGVGCWSLLPCKRVDGEYNILNAPDELGELPKELYESFMETAETSSSGGNGAGGLKEILPEQAFSQIWTDGRKNVVAGMAWSMLLRGYTEEEVMDTCLKFAAENCEPPLSPDIVRRKVEYTVGRVELKTAERDAEVERVINGMKTWQNRR